MYCCLTTLYCCLTTLPKVSDCVRASPFGGANSKKEVNMRRKLPWLGVLGARNCNHGSLCSTYFCYPRLRIRGHNPRPGSVRGNRCLSPLHSAERPASGARRARETQKQYLAVVTEGEGVVRFPVVATCTTSGTRATSRHRPSLYNSFRQIRVVGLTLRHPGNCHF